MDFEKMIKAAIEKKNWAEVKRLEMLQEIAEVMDEEEEEME